MITGIANGMFGSGGGLIALPAFQKLGLETIKAHASSLAATLFLSISSAVSYAMNGNINFLQAVKYIPFGIIGAVVGAKLLVKISVKLLKIIFSCLLIYAGFKMVSG